MRRAYLQEARITEGIVGGTARRPSASRNVAPFSVVEDVVGLRAELERQAFLDGKVFKQGHIEVGAAGVVERVPANVSEGQTTRRRKCVDIVEGSREAGIWGWEGSGARIANLIGTGTRSCNAVGYAGIVRVEYCAEGAPRPYAGDSR